MNSVLITGGTENSGLACAMKFAQENWRVIITSRSAGKAEAAAEKIKAAHPGSECYGTVYELSDPQSVHSTRDFVSSKCPALDAVVLCAADLGLDTHVLDADIGRWQEIITSNVVGSYQCARTFAKDMKERGTRGSIVFFGSVNSRVCVPDRSAYVASKGAILSLSRAMAMELGEYGIRVNCLMPGPIVTDRYAEMDAEELARQNAAVPVGRVSTPEDIANCAYFLASEMSGNMSGSALVVDGGLSVKNPCVR